MWGTDPAARSTADTLAWIKGNVRPDPERRFEEPGADDTEIRYGSWYRETVEGRRQYGLYGYTIRPEGHVQIALISDSPDDLPWVKISTTDRERGPGSGASCRR